MQVTTTAASAVVVVVVLNSRVSTCTFHFLFVKSCSVRPDSGGRPCGENWSSTWIYYVHCKSDGRSIRALQHGFLKRKIVRWVLTCPLTFTIYSVKTVSLKYSLFPKFIFTTTFLINLLGWLLQIYYNVHAWSMKFLDLILQLCFYVHSKAKL